LIDGFLVICTFEKQLNLSVKPSKSGLTQTKVNGLLTVFTNLSTTQNIPQVLNVSMINVCGATNVLNITFEELKEALKRLDEVTLLELLGLQSDDLVDRFDDLIEKKQEYLIKELD
jgi:hypothetical protein